MQNSTQIPTDMDIMQHIRNLYDIVGTTSKPEKSLLDMIKDNAVNIPIDWYGTEEQYKAAKARGEITETMNCYITDNDDFNPTK